MSPSTLLIFALGTLIAAAAVGAMLSLIRRSPDPSRGMVCGRCAYPVGGLPSLTCPECGADLRAAGIVPSHTRGRIARPVVLCVMWTIVIWACYFMIRPSIPRHGTANLYVLLVTPWIAGLILIPIFGHHAGRRRP